MAKAIDVLLSVEQNLTSLRSAYLIQISSNSANQPYIVSQYHVYANGNQVEENEYD